jgi:pSer/pThr/pTyr-binding forkhead associated (FHA) protein
MTTVVQRARLLSRPGDAALVAHEIAEHANLGRLPDNEVALAHPFLSGRHARIYREGEAYWVEDLGSRNGTRVDGVAVTRPVRLERLHVITLADTIDLVFMLDQVSHAGPAAAAPGAPTAAAGSREATVTELTRFDIQFDTVVDPRGFADVAAVDATPAAPPTRRLGLVLVHATGRMENLTLHDGDNVLGRGDDCDIVLPDPERWLGRRHATIRVAPEGVQLVDNQSMNGTFIAERRIDTAVLEEGASFRLGPYLELTLVGR